MTTIRQRKRINASEQTHNSSHHNKTSKSNVKGTSGPSTWSMLCYVVGALMALCLGLVTSHYVATLHENDLWFSSIKVHNCIDLFISKRVLKGNYLQKLTLKIIAVSWQES
ncbi:hypothetical protein GDO81_022791 [Engystomops pustulosus]|uniref:Uncharacterized protein n=1 Tax=Engystomops pustulosus TaxID=76066 RepID=A0AAV6YWM1_ENGPU|nr:hypothetical protein GDO81_022791 [Engystomops pustulosus]